MSGPPALAADCKLDRDDLLMRPGREAGPTEVYIHTFINDIVAIRDADQSFSSDVFIRIEWQDLRLAHGGDTPCAVGLGDVWWPELQLMNRRTVQNVREVRPLVSPDGTVGLLLRGFGEFSFKADLSDFPFDEQELFFDILSVYSDDEIDFVYDFERFALASELSVANFDVELTAVEERSDYIASSQREHARLLVKMRAVRLAGFYTWQQLVPLFLVVMMAWIVFWIPREHVPSRIGLAATSMLTLIAYRFAMSSVLPPIAYLTRLDVFMIGASVLVFIALATAVAVTYVMDLVDEGLAERIHRGARVAIPVLLALITWLSFFA
jgi:hypothetical protein